MAKNNSICFRQSIFVTKPRRNLLPCKRVCSWRGALANEVKLAFFGTVAHPREVVCNDP